MKTSTFNTIAILTGLAVILITVPVSAAVIASTSFENEPVFTTNYMDTGNPAVDHDLVNNAGQPVVDSTAAGSGAAGDLGFDSRWENTQGGDGYTDGTTYNGVQEAGPTWFTGPTTDGTKQYVLVDSDGRHIVDFDPVAIPATGPTSVRIDYFFRSTSWEVGDFLNIFVTIDGTAVVPLLETSGQDIDNLGLEGAWHTVAADLTGLGSSAVLSLVFETDNEAVAVDNLVFTNIPEPASMCLLALGGLTLLARRRA